MAKYHGKKAKIYFSTSGSGAAVNVANLNAWAINGTTDKVETTSFGDTNKTYVQGLEDVTGTIGGFFDDATSAALYTGKSSSDGIKVYIYPSADAPGRYFYGPAWLDLSFQGSTTTAVTLSGNLAANGSWGAVLA